MTALRQHNADVYRDGARLCAACSGCGWKGPESYPQDFTGLLTARMEASLHTLVSAWVSALVGPRA